VPARAKIRVKVARNELRRVGKAEAGKRVARTTRQTFNRARVLSPWDTGLLRGAHSMSVRTVPSRRKVIGTVSAATDYAAAVHEGSAPHIIRPRKKQALKFKIGGRIVIVRSVRHPGARAQPWLATALAEVAGQQNFKLRP